MRIEEEIKKFTDNAEYECTHGNLQGCLEFKQLAEWLKELKQLREQEPCEDAISRQTAINSLGEQPLNWTDERYEKQAVEDWLDTKKMLQELPSIQPKVKTGHWATQNIHNCHTDFKCSVCGYTHNFMHLYGEPTADYNYCPNCGAKMIEPQESEGEDE